jgi:cytochrome P450
MELTEDAFKLLHEQQLAQFQGKINGPPPSFPLGNAGSFLGSNPWVPAMEWIEEYGDLVLIWIGSNPALLLNDPDLIGELLVKNGPDFYKDSPRPQLLPVTTDSSCFIANGEAWREKREAHPFAAQSFRDWMISQLPILRNQTRVSGQDLIRKSAEDHLDFRKTMERVTFDGFAVMAVGETLDQQAYKDFQCVADEGSKRMASPIHLPDINPVFHSARQRWFAVFDRYMHSESCLQGNNLVAKFLPDTAYNEEDFCAEIANIFPAGIFSTTSTVMHTLYMLHKHPDHLAEVRRALDELGPEPSWPSLSACNALRFALYEAMRLYPGAPFFMRNVHLDSPLDFAGVTWPANTTVFITPKALHRNREFWGENANDFVPSRWHEMEAKAPIGSAYYWPFGRGPRECLGKYLALFYAMTVLQIFVQEYELVFAEDSAEEGFYFACLVCDGLKVKLAGRGDREPG